MSEQNLAQLFERFRRAGDAAALAEVFDATAAPLFSIARKLTRDRSEAEDVVQSMWLTALERVESFDATRKLEPWLVGILIRRANEVRRKRNRVEAIELADEPRSRDASDPLESRELALALAAAFEKLTSAEREVLVPLLLEDKRAVEIARELAKRPDTIHMRVRRGLERLRRLLPAGHAFGFVAAWRDRSSISQLKEKVMQAARSPSPILAPSIAATFVLSKFAVAIALVAATTIAVGTAKPWRWLANEASARSIALADSPTSTKSSAADLISPPPSRNANDRAELAANSPIAAAPQSPSKWLIVGQLSGAPNGDWSGTWVYASTDDPAIPKFLNFEVNAASDGSYSIDVSSVFANGVGAIAFELSFHNPRCLTASGAAKLSGGKLVTENGVTRLEMHCDATLKPASIVRGTVTLAANDASKFYFAGIVASNADGDVKSELGFGRPQVGTGFAAHCAGDGPKTLLLASEHSVPIVLIVNAQLGDSNDIGNVSLPLGLSVRGRVTGLSVADCAHWQVAAQRKGASSWHEMFNNQFAWTNGECQRVAEIADIEGSGTFEFTGLAALDYELCVQPKPQKPQDAVLSSANANTVTVHAPAVDVVLSVGSSTVEITFPSDKPGPTGATTYLLDTTTARGPGRSMRPGEVARFSVIPGRSYELNSASEGWQTVDLKLVAPPAGQTMTQTLAWSELAKAALHWKIVDGDGQPIQRVTIGFFQSDLVLQGVNMFDQLLALDTPALSRSLVNSDGDFTILDVPLAKYVVRVHAGSEYRSEDEFHQPAQFELAATSALDERTIALPLGGRIRLTTTSTKKPLEVKGTLELRDSHDVTVPVIEAQFDSTGCTTFSEVLSVGTVDLLPNLAPGDYTLTITRPGFADKKLAAKVEAGKATELAFDADAP